MTDDEGEHYVTANLKYDRIKNDFKHMEVDEDVEKRFDSIKHDIFNADTRYSPQPVSSGFFMWNTWSSNCMHRVILSYLDFGEKLWNFNAFIARLKCNIKMMPFWHTVNGYVF